MGQCARLTVRMERRQLIQYAVTVSSQIDASGYRDVDSPRSNATQRPATTIAALITGHSWHAAGRLGHVPDQRD